MFPRWNWTLIAVSVSFHGVAILSTLFRLWYQWYTAHMWWDDAWAMLAFLANVAFLIVSVLEQPISDDALPRFFTVGNWIIAFAYPILVWAARISILTSMVHVLHPEGKLRHITVGIGVSFGIMGLAMLGQRLQSCIEENCLINRTAFMAQTITDCAAGILLTALPIWSLCHMSLGRKCKILVASIFSASMVISVVAVIEVVMLFRSVTSGSIVFDHVKVACSMIVCNLLVIVAFVYSLLYKGESPKIEFTTVDLALGGPSQATSVEMSFSALSKNNDTIY